MNPSSELHAKIQANKVLLCCSIETFSPSTAELAGMLGFDLVWADLEHMGGGPPQVELFCLGAKAGGAWPFVRVPFAERSHIMLALEAGARLVSVPMVETTEAARRIVEHGKYKPLGNRGFAGSTRGVSYGVGNPLGNIEWADRETHLFPQIETVEALRRCREIVEIDGISGAMIGPADLSISLGKPLKFDSPELVSAVVQAISVVRSLNKIAAIATGHPTLVKAALQAGAQILICTGERGSLRAQWQQTLKEMRELIK